MARGFPGLYFLNAVERTMDFLTIGISGIELKSNVQLGNELLMYKVTGKESSTKSARVAVQEYDTELTLVVAVLYICLGCNVDIATSTSTDEPEVITEDGYEEEEIQDAINYVEKQ